MISIDELEQSILISQVTDSHTRRVIVPLVTSFNKSVSGTDPKMTLKYLLKKRLPGFASHLENIGVDLDKDISNNLRVSFAGIPVHLGNVDLSLTKHPDVFGYGNGQKHHSLSLKTLFIYEYLTIGDTFSLFNTQYQCVLLNSTTKYLTVNGRKDTAPLDLSKFFILLQE